jgi:hypothetical protein
MYDHVGVDVAGARYHFVQILANQPKPGKKGVKHFL